MSARHWICISICAANASSHAARAADPADRWERSTVFNILGPLTNPALAPAQILGVYAVDLVPLMAEAMVKLGVRHGFVVHGSDGLDEITLSGETEIAEVKNGAFRLWKFSPEDAGLERASLSELQGGDAADNAAILHAIFAGETGPRRDIVSAECSGHVNHWRVGAGFSSWNRACCPSHRFWSHIEDAGRPGGIWQARAIIFVKCHVTCPWPVSNQSVTQLNLRRIA